LSFTLSHSLRFLTDAVCFHIILLSYLSFTLQTERPEDRVYKSVMELDGAKYTSSFW